MLGGNLWLNGARREGQVYIGANAALHGKEGLHSNSNHKQEDQYQVFHKLVRCSSGKRTLDQSVQSLAAVNPTWDYSELGFLVNYCNLHSSWLNATL